jgi:phage terminase large subunit GpA-like protein
VCQKSAQIGWTDGVINNFIGYVMHMAPGPMIVMFPRDQTAEDFSQEKLVPMIDSTPALAELVDTRSRKSQNTILRKKFPGGFLKLVGSNSPGGVKSTPAKYLVVEEPDDCNLNVKGQGDSIKLLEERGKSFHDAKLLAGGTPSIEGLSSICDEMLQSDRRYLYCPCHECGDAHVLAWENVTIPEDPAQNHPIFGKKQPEKAFYTCPHCGSVWTNAQKNTAVSRGTFKATAEFRGTAGFYLNELCSSFEASSLTRLAEKYLLAVHEANQGEIGALITFWNATLGLPWVYQTNMPDAEALAARAEDYDELAVPWGGLVLTAGVDVQHDRLAVIIRAWGRGEESWLVYWGEIYGQTLVPNQGAWQDLDRLLTRGFDHESGAKLRVRAASIDSSDGASSDAVYSYVRTRSPLGFMAVKGANDQDSGREIFAPPKPSVDTDRQNKAHKYGLKPFIVGTGRAKDLILEGRVNLQGTGAGRMHWYRGVRPDYWEQLLSEIKAPHRTLRGRKTWQKKAGLRNEGLDCEVYALHAARSLKVHLFKETHWAALELACKQAHARKNPPPTPPAAPRPVSRTGGGFSASARGWKAKQ